MMKFSLNRSLNFYFWIATFLLLFAFLGSREIWTQEWRWGEIVRAMQLHHDYFHPILAGKIYFDKPLLSYWLMAGTTVVTSLSTLAIRLPSAIAGLISIFCIYQIGKKWLGDAVGQLAAVMLATTYYFVFWARTASTDALNLAGILCAVAWYFSKRDKPNFKNYSIFFMLLALTALLKGLIGIIIALLIITPDVFSRFKQYIPTIQQLLLALFPAILLYLLPFYLTSLVNHAALTDSGLYEVYRENILRFLEPFDHKDPFYTYFIYLPVYLLPWTFFFLPALYQYLSRWKQLESATKQLILGNLLVFLFLTFSGSRRSYYILPLVPFAILLSAQWVTETLTLIPAFAGTSPTSGRGELSDALTRNDANKKLDVNITSTRKGILAHYTAIFSFFSLFSWFIVFQPLYYSDGGLVTFSNQLKQLMQKAPHKNWHIVFFNADNRLSFYLPGYSIDFLKGDPAKFKSINQYDILVTQQTDLQALQPFAQSVIVTPPHRGNRWLSTVVPDAPVGIVINNDTQSLSSPNY